MQFLVRIMGRTVPNRFTYGRLRIHAHERRSAVHKSKERGAIPRQPSGHRMGIKVSSALAEFLHRARKLKIKLARDFPILRPWCASSGIIKLIYANNLRSWRFFVDLTHKLRDLTALIETD